MTDPSLAPPPERCPFCGSADFRDDFCATCNQSRRMLQDRQLDTDLPCLKCGYALRGLRFDNPCPECGTPVVISLYGDFLYQADPRWLRTVHSGVRLLIAAVIASALLILTGIILRASSIPYGQSAADVALLLTVTGLVIMAANFIGWWRITDRDDNRFARERLRIFVRAAAAIVLSALVLTFGTVWIGVTTFIPTGIPTAEWIMVWTAGISIYVIWPLRTVIGLYYLRRLCVRIPNLDISRRCKGLGLSVAIAWGGTVLFVLLMFAAAGNSGDLASCFLIGLGIGALIWNGVYLATLAGISSQFREIRRARGPLS